MSLKSEVRKGLIKIIKEAQLTYNKKLPSENEMASLLNVSRITIRAVLADLENQGIVRRRQGSGTYVNENFINIKSNLNPMESYGSIIEKMGYALEIKTFGARIVETPAYLQNSDDYDQDKIICADRWYYADKKLCVVCIDFLPLKYKKDLDKLKDYKDSIFQFLYDQYKIKLNKGIIELKTSSLTEVPYLSDFYEGTAEKDSYLLIKGTEFDEKQKPVLFTQEYINTDIIELSMMRERKILYKENR